MEKYKLVCNPYSSKGGIYDAKVWYGSVIVLVFIFFHQNENNTVLGGVEVGRRTDVSI